MELKRCPFCGAEAKIQTADGAHDYAVYCTNPECEAATRRWWESREIAAKKWNRRADNG